MVAKTYDHDRDFDLAREYDWLIDNNGKEKDLEDAGYETIPSSTVLQCIAAHLCKQIRRKDILKLNKSEFIDAWPVVKEGIFHAVDYLGTHLRIPVSRLLPYNAILVPFTYFFLKNKGITPSIIQQKLLGQYFWWASISQRFTSGTEWKISLDLEKMDQILIEKQPSYLGEEISLHLDELKWRWFSTGDAFCKAILCLYAFFEPKSFAYNNIVKIDNSWLKIATSKNYHHFFPKAFLKKKDFQDWQANSLLNITIVDDYLNKRKIRAKPPSVYMKEFGKTNPLLEKTMKTHLIENLDTFGIWGDDYEKFLEERGTRVLEELNNRLHPTI